MTAPDAAVPNDAGVAALTLRHYADIQEQLGWEGYALTIRALADRVQGWEPAMLALLNDAWEQGYSAASFGQKSATNPYRSNP